jgi:hypothetical protein
MCFDIQLRIAEDTVSVILVLQSPGPPRETLFLPFPEASAHQLLCDEL